MGTLWQPDRLWTQQIGGCTEIPGVAHHTSWSQPLVDNQASRCSSVRNRALLRQWMPGKVYGGSQDQKREQELLWRQSFVKPAMLWDSRRGKKSSCSPDFRRKGSGEFLRLNNMWKPAWVDEQLVSLGMQMGLGVSPLKSISPNKREPGRRAGSEFGVLTALTVSTLCQQENLTEAVGALESLAQSGSPISESLFYTVLKLCAAKKDLAVGRRVHDLTVKLGFESSTYLGNHILRMYASGGRIQEAMDVFTRVGKPDVFMWFSVISAHAKHGKAIEAIQLYHKMRSSGVEANSHIFGAALQACAFATDVKSGREVHCDVLHSGMPPNLFVGNCLVDMYVKCGELEDARRVFDSLATKNVVTWTALIAGYANHGLGQEALVLHGQMEQQGLIVGNDVTVACLLKACASAGALQKGRQLHSQIVENKQLDNIIVANCLVDMYAKCGELGDARRVFESLASKDVVTWNALIAGYANHGLGQEALALYGRMKQHGLIVGNHVTFACLLKACGSAGALQKGKQLHLQIVESGQLGNIILGNCLVDMYVKCGELEDARQVFDSLATKDVVTWTALISGYANQGRGPEALFLYGQLEKEGLIVADEVTVACLLKACASAGALQKGRQLHSQIVERGQLNNVMVGTCLVDMYAKCGELEDARRVFDTLATKMW